MARIAEIAAIDEKHEGDQLEPETETIEIDPVHRSARENLTKAYLAHGDRDKATSLAGERCPAGFPT